MVDKTDVKKIEDKLQDEIDNIAYYIQREVKTGIEETLYREAKLFVFAESIKNNLDNFFIYNEKNSYIIDKFVETFLYENNIIEKIYTYLYESNGTKYDLFMDRVRLLDSIQFFLDNR